MIALRTFAGPDVGPWLADVARLRMSVFREYPYLYDGSIDYERDYLQTYAGSAESLFVLAFDGDRVVGASTGVPLADEVEAFREPFRGAGIDEREVFYCGESVLLPEHRGRGIGNRFFDAREQHARSLGRVRWSAFCSVLREADDPRRPPGHRDNLTLWRRRGYAPRPDMCAQLAWQEPGQGEPVLHSLEFWLRAL